MLQPAPPFERARAQATEGRQRGPRIPQAQPIGQCGGGSRSSQRQPVDDQRGAENIARRQPDTNGVADGQVQPVIDGDVQSPHAPARAENPGAAAAARGASGARRLGLHLDNRTGTAIVAKDFDNGSLRMHHALMAVPSSPGAPIIAD